MPEHTDLLTEEEIATLNQARDILDALQKRAWSLGWDRQFAQDRDRPHAVSIGIVYGVASSAADAIFDVLNSIDSRVHPIAEDLLHNRKPEAVA